MERDHIKDSARRFALKNAVEFKGKANRGAVLGKVLALEPEYRKMAKEIATIVDEAVSEVNAMTLDEQEKALKETPPEVLEKREKKEEVELEDVDTPVVMRFAPGPSGPLHIGHARTAVLNDILVKKYGGTYILRIEDTNPLKIVKEAYEMIPEDLKWLGVTVNKTVVQSDRFDIYYDLAKELLEMGHAYICCCEVERWRKMRDEKISCPDREQPPNEHLMKWELMHSGKFAEGEASYVVKTDMQHPNPAVRDFVGFRIVDAPHPMTEKRYRVYPTMNFSVAVDDHLDGMTHVLRGKDHLNNTYRQGYIFDHFGWRKPVYIHHGRIGITGTVLKTSVIKEGIVRGEFEGWGDIRLGTLRALASRGISPESIYEEWTSSSLKEVDIDFSWKNLYARNREIVDSQADRYFFVGDPYELTISGTKRLEANAPLHPHDPQRGARHLVVEEKEGDDGPRVLVSKEDVSLFSEGQTVRLKDLCNITIKKDLDVEFAGNDPSKLVKGSLIIHWVPSHHNIPGKLLYPDGTAKEGKAEKGILSADGKVVQLERVGYAKVEVKEGSFAARFAHK